jgi:alkylation response protein AidB-like acyl-CoA dehydrogenase
MALTRYDEPAAEEFRTEIRGWLDAAVPAEWAGSHETLTPERAQQIQMDWDRELHRSGWAGIAWPGEFGGRGLGSLEELIFYEESARAGAPDGFGRIGRILAGPTIMAAGTDAQKSTYLPRILDGSEIWCQGFSEPGAGSDLASVTTRAEKVEGGYLVTGQKIWTSFAQYSRRCLMLVKTSPDAPRHRNLGFLLLDMEQEGVDVRPIRQINGQEEFSEVFFDRAFVADDDLVGAENDGWRIAMLVLGNERGTTEAATRLIEASALLSTLEASDVSDRARLAELQERAELLRWHIVRASEEKAGGEDWFTAGSILKVQWSELIQDIVAFGVDASDAATRGYWRQHFLDARAMSIYSGTNEIQRNIITDRVLKVAR